MINRIKEIYGSKELLRNLVVKELKLKYRNSALGFLWSFFNPLMMMVVYTIAFKYILGLKEPNFPMFILTGILPWNFFLVSLMQGTTSVVVNGPLIKKVYFPREIIPLSLVFSNFVNYMITLIVLFAGLIIFRIPVGLPILLLPVTLIVYLAFVIGLTLILSAVNVYYRDTAHFIEIIFQAWMYLTPIIYSLSKIPEPYRKLFLLNPMTLIIENLRDSLFYNTFPNLKYYIAMIIVSFLTLFIGSKVFHKMQKGFAEEI